jgi:hypothetical protein
MQPVHYAIAAIPMAIYFVLIGALRLRRRPLVTSGWRDTLTLGLAASGFVAIGPMQLFFPSQAAARWHAWVWLALFLLYLLSLTMLLLNSRPRLIAYGMTDSQFDIALLSAAHEIDPSANWQGEVLNMPHSAMQLAKETTGATRVQQIVHLGMLQNVQDWLALERSFVKQAAHVRCVPGFAGWPFVIAGMLLLASAVGPLLADPGTALAQLQRFLDR